MFFSSRKRVYRAILHRDDLAAGKTETADERCSNMSQMWWYVHLQLPNHTFPLVIIQCPPGVSVY